MKNEKKTIKEEVTKARIIMEGLRKDYQNAKKDRFARFIGLDEKFKKMYKDAQERYLKLLNKLNNNNG